MKVLRTGILMGVLTSAPIALAQLEVGGDMSSNELAATIQADLVTLGYEPGNIAGEVTN